MTMAELPDFVAFFEALWGHGPFPWQVMLAERVAGGHWPRALDLPTAAGKTACIDIALYALASQASIPTAERTAPRRVWLVVDRRVVVDEAFERARLIAEKLANARSGPLAAVAERLLAVSGTNRPLAVGRLRGGIYRDDGWARIPSQPAVIASTVDQIGSALLFRAYGHSQLAAPIFAGLAANDSLILLDEAHCSVPFLETLGAIERFRGPAWAEELVPTPFDYVVLSATPPRGIPRDAIFPGSERERALNHPVLHRRLRSPKPARLVEVERTQSRGNDPLVDRAAEEGIGFLREGKKRVALMVNRVLTAAKVAGALRDQVGETADIVLFTGRMRSYERNRVVDRWKPFLRASDPEELSRPLLVVATQCLEVGADFSFDALVTEAASLDALRQRFGRLARMGSDEPAPAAILAREEDLVAEKGDPIYGTALASTWRFLRDHARAADGGVGAIDMAVHSIERLLEAVDDWTPYLKPTEGAPVLLPAHVDLLCQTAPTAYPEPQIPRYLHGAPEAAEVRVAWRADLRDDQERRWAETVALCPPCAGELLSVPLWRLRAWLAGSDFGRDFGDLEGGETEPEEEPTTATRARPCLLWRGRDRSIVTDRVEDILPGDVVLVPAEYGLGGFGQAAPAEVLGEAGLDLWEPARKESRREAAIRLNRTVLSPWLAYKPLARLLKEAEAEDLDRDALFDAIDELLESDSQPEGPPGPPRWWLEVLRECRGGRVEPYPAGGIVLFARRAARRSPLEEPDLFADEDELTSEADSDVLLADHLALVERAAARLAEFCLPYPLRDPVRRAAWWHDVGKVDERFQILLRHGDEVAVARADAPLAKSERVPISPRARELIRGASNLPRNFRHEMVSMQILQSVGVEGIDHAERDLVVHLVASHHGHARPFAPVSDDPAPPSVSARVGHVSIEFPAKDRCAMTPPHRVDSGVPDRFWRVCRRYGWWGLAYLEAIVRLSDWFASARVDVPECEELRK